MKYDPDSLHIYTAPSSQLPPYLCPSSSSSLTCSDSNTSQPSLGAGRVRKRRRSTSSKTTNLSCGTCGKKFSRSDNLMTHQRVHTDERPYKCSLCGKAFRWMSALRHHQNMHRRRALKMKQMKSNYYTPHQESQMMKKRENGKQHIYLTSEFAQFAPDAFDLGIPKDSNKNVNVSSDFNNTGNDYLHPSIAKLFNQLK